MLLEPNKTFLFTSNLTTYTNTYKLRLLCYIKRLTPYLERFVLRWWTNLKSYFPRMVTYLTPGISRRRPPLIRTLDHFCRLWPIPSIPTYNLTLVKGINNLRVLRLAEFGFFGLLITIFKQKPFFCGQPDSPNLKIFFFLCFLIFLEIYWFKVTILKNLN